MDGFLDALRVHTPGTPLEAGVLLAAVLTAFLAFRKVAGAGTAALIAAGSVAAFVQVGHPSIPLGIAVAGLLLSRRRAPFTFSRGLLPFAREYSLVLAGFCAYELARFSVVASFETASANSNRIVDSERSLGLFFEPRFQELATRDETVVRAWNMLYSHGFLALVVGTVLWLYFADPARYRLYRNALAASTVLAIALIAVFPAAPPRLMEGLGIDDTVTKLGNAHAFANEFAAIPSLHVGWFALTGFVLAMPYTGWRSRVIAVSPGLAMEATVIATGNHYWVDGLVGTVVAVAPALVLRSLAADGGIRPLAARVRGLSLSTALLRRMRTSTLALGGLFLYLGVAEVVRPGFTDFWGYLFFQVGVTIALLGAGEVVFRNEGGLSPITHWIAVVCTFADVFGTDGDLYARIDEYDKLTHFMGTAAITAGVYDVLRALAVRRGSNRPSSDRLYLAMAVGIAVGIGWEVYEYLGDRLFQTARAQGRWDTLNDLVSDSVGAFTVGILLWMQERAGAPLPEEAGLPPGS